ncbi:MAG: hypothetical protein K8I30_06250, partial [Anaerolineae bacterium]|nr:hypothetical protein [Anaerolineae bacterium]
MPVTYKWDNSEKTVICYRVEGRWSWEEIYQTLEWSRRLWHSVSHVVDIIVDMTASSAFPADNILGHLRNIMSYYDSTRVGNTAIVGATDYFRMAAELYY